MKKNKPGLPDESLRLIVDSVPVGIVITDNSGDICFVNVHGEKMFGHKRAELTGKSIETLMPERFRNGHSQMRTMYFRNPSTRAMGVGRELFALRSDGSEFPVEVGLNYLSSDDRPLVIATIIDITERRIAEQRIKDRDQRLREVIDNTTDAIMVFDNEGVIEILNSEARRLFYPDADNGSNNISDIITPENREHYKDMLDKVYEGKTITDYETERICSDGKRISVSTSLVYIPNDGGKYIETVRDISDRIAMRNKIIDIEKAQIIGKMAEGFAHHMGTPLASMLLRVQMLMEDVSAFSEYKDITDKLNLIEKQVLYGQKVIQRLLRFAARPENEKSPEKVSRLLEESTEMIRPILKKRGIELSVKVKESLILNVDSNLINLVFSDIMMNAIDAMPDGGELSIESHEDKESQSVSIQFSDTGVGISKETIPFVFEPFYSTKPAGQGTGLGLSVAKRIVLDHGGNIRINSKEGIGTSVIITMPRYVGKGIMK